MLFEGSELTKEDRESQLYDDFEHFRQHKEESINDYHVRFSMLINDMRNIKMTMPKLLLNSKFMNNMLPEWGRFVTAVKLNRGLRESNYDKLFAYLKQHEAHAKENKMVLERLSQAIVQPTADPLALLSNVSNTQHSSPSSSTSSITPFPPPHANSTDYLIKNLTSTLALLTQSYRTFLPQTNNQLRTSSNPRNQATVQDGRVVNRVGNVNQGQARLGQARTAKCYNYNGTRKWSSFGCRIAAFFTGGPDNAFDDDVDEQPVQDLALNMDNVFPAEDYDAFDSDVDEAPTAQTMFMANLSSADPITDETGPSYDSDILSEYVKDNEVLVVHSNASSVKNDTFMMIYNDMCEPSAPSVSNSSWNTVVKNSLTAELATYREQVELIKGYKNPLCLTCAKQAQPALYNGHGILKDNHAWAKVHNTEDTLEITEITRKKMNTKITDPECVTHKVKIAPHDYSKENILAAFTPQKQLTLEQIYWSNDLMKLKSEAVKEQAKVSRPIKAFTMKHDAIDQKNLLIANDNLIAECLSKEVFSVATKSELNVARFAKKYVANTSVEARYLALEAELATLRDKSHQENQGELMKTKIRIF
nr:hypothetical protein [Tanacetum cinerariifolium]